MNERPLSIRLLFCWFLGCLALIPLSHMQASAPQVVLARGGEARQPIVIPEDANESVRGAARDLAEYLGRITGAEFRIETGDGRRGIAVGRVGDFPALGLSSEFQLDNPWRQDDFLLQSHRDGLYVLGASDLATQFAVWGLLEQFGYRLFFLTDTWEVVPEIPNLAIAIHEMQRSDYVTRQAPRGAPWSNRELWNRWRVRNRINSTFELRTGHAYDAIIRTNPDVFREHPEWYALVDGVRRNAGRVDGRGNIKFCIGNPDLRKFIVEDAVRRMRANPEMDSISMDPSDGGHWCECELCAAIGSVSDQVVLLANDVAEAINDLGFGDKYVGIYAYHLHSPPPSIEVHPKVVVSIATAFIRGGFTMDELVEGWREKASILGIRDYHDVFTWSHDTPRRARGGNLAYLQRTIPDFYASGARFMNSEASDSWGANGLGYWISPRLLWDVQQAEQIDDLVEDFLTRSFGPAAEPMRGYYTLMNWDRSVRSTEDVVARLYRYLQEAFQATQDQAIRERLSDLLLFTRYLELYYDYRSKTGDARQAAFEQVLRHAWRMSDRYMLSTRAIYDRERYRDRAMIALIPEGVSWGASVADDPWKDDTPYSNEELAQILRDGIANNQPTVLDFEAVEFSDDLVPAAPLGLTVSRPGRMGDAHRGRLQFFTWIPEGRRELDFEVTGGLITGYRDRGNVNFALHAKDEVTLEPVSTDESVPPDGETYKIKLTTPHSGLHWLEWSDGSDRTQVILPDDLPWTVKSSMEEPMRLAGRWSLYFYVPKGTEVIGGYADSTTGSILNPQGETVFEFSDLDQADYFSIPVPEGMDGQLWMINHAAGARRLMTVPPFLARSPEELLLPREVVEADSR